MKMRAEDKLCLELRHSNDSGLLDSALLRMYQKMTRVEKACRKAIHRNGVGLDKNAAGPMCTFAKLLIDGKLTDKHRRLVRKMIPRFSGQLRDLALEQGLTDD